MKKINLCLTFSGTVYARLIRLVTKDKYTHISLALEEDKNVWYSMGRKGKNRFWVVRFQVENVRERFTEWFPKTELMILEKEVSDEVYYKVLAILEKYSEDTTKYNYLGVLGATVNKPIEHKNRYFCSELVANILNEVEALDIKQPAVLTRPMDFLADESYVKKYEGDVYGYLRNIS
ncbi:hypothetical protein [uncultured Clostridium sp.]|uniref:hypothetical protein n=1 Tax=uncultured Clostridium sp. TaxID=59620 RepID=UPI002634489F|nr:hypothetical protein [uncultured Clostridium sp.]